jgi:hypothetical protein
MKFLSALFLIFMCMKSMQIIYNMQYETGSESAFEEIKITYDSDVCNKYSLFYVFALFLGAFWNVKKLIKVGTV